MGIIRDSCVIYSRAVIIIINLLIYFVLYALLYDMPDLEASDKAKAYQETVHVDTVGFSNAPSVLTNRIIVDGEPKDFNEAIIKAYFGQGYQQAKEDLYGLETLRLSIDSKDPELLGMAAHVDF